MIDEQPDYETQARGALQPAPHKFSRKQISERVTEAKRQKKERMDAGGIVLEPMEVKGIKSMRSGDYYHLNALTSGQNAHRGVVTVKHRTGPGEPFVCLTDHANACQHIRFVQQYIEQHGTPE